MLWRSDREVPNLDLWRHLVSDSVGKLSVDDVDKPSGFFAPRMTEPVHVPTLVALGGLQEPDQSTKLAFHHQISPRVRGAPVPNRQRQEASVSYR